MKIEHLIGLTKEQLLDSKRIRENATIGATNSGDIPTVANPKVANSKKKVKSVSALDQNKVSLFGGPMENIQAPIIKRR
jgi:hypothetical protein